MASREWNTLDEQTKQLIRGHQNAIPVRIAELARALGVTVKAATLPPGISGELRPDGNGGFVVRVNRHDPSKRQRFTVAHEIAHFLLHQDHIGSGISDDVLYRSDLSDRREQQANRLAADILMPDEMVKEEADDAMEMGIGDVALHLADRFNVSEAAMRIKLER